MKNKIATLGLAALVSLGLTGCSKDELIFEGETSQGYTKVERVDRWPFMRDDRRVSISKGDTTWTIYDNSRVGITNSNDNVKVETSDGMTVYRTDEFIDVNGRIYSSDEPLEAEVVAKSKELVLGRFKDMYDQALYEVPEALKDQVH